MKISLTTSVADKSTNKVLKFSVIMIERRNFYRILHIQPDAPMAVVKESYWVLMQKLVTHPELASPDWNVNLLNLAYSTLGDPLKRDVYDQELLDRYHIKILSQGALGSSAKLEAEQKYSERTDSLNQRNYYRILQVQPDAPITTIKASYQILKKDSFQDKALLDEAYRILSDPAARMQYDALLMSNLLRAAKETANKKTNLPSLIPELDAAEYSVKPYRAMITYYCFFCKTPYVPQTGFYQSENCLECASPLLLLNHKNMESTRRTMMRTPVRGELVFYLFWPGRPVQGIFQDLSPAGMRFLTDVILDFNDVIKIDAPNFQAVAEVTHKRHESHGVSVGTRFITVKFDQQHGNFVTLQV
ncbi:molecular chaperone DnaJ [uncultured Nitrosomonas sp.]|uniref:J domain-containing protein n=1 Tax=uncultured Nitrosomonas sp. TaxID=156424 RepID=UPI0025F11613|nr:molecular chaperone DnaJ [uncultured Nitrosomonas sp.]